jgi:hypothetical protein
VYDASVLENKLNSDDDKEMADNTERPRLSMAYSMAQVTPLFAAIIAPFSTLLDIPALTQKARQAVGPFFL